MPTNETKCPTCGSREHYRLKDNRLQCADCRKKFTEQMQSRALPEATLRQIVQAFWRMVPASAAASQQGMNSKTLQKYYDRLRRSISQANERCTELRFGGIIAPAGSFRDYARQKGLSEGLQPLFCLAKEKEQIFLLPVAKLKIEGEMAGIAAAETVGWIYALDQKAGEAVDLDRIHFLLAAQADARGGEAGFWMNAKKGLVKYHGGFRKNFHLFLREMEFRYNSRDEVRALDYLLKILVNTTETGEEHAQV